MSLPPLGVFRGPLLLYFQAWRLSRAVSSICLPPDFGTTQRQTPALDHPRWRGGGGGSNSGGITRSPVSPQHPRPRAEALTRDLSASLTCSARFEIFLAGAASRSSSRKQSAQLTFLRPLPILRLVKGISSQTVRGEGPPRRRVGPGSGELKCAPPAGRPQLHSGSLGSCVCTQPRPPPHPLPRRWPPARPAHRVIFSRPYYIWPQRLLRRQRQQAGATGWLGDVAGSGPVTLR